MTIEVDIRAKCFGGLMLTITADRDGVQDAMFSSSRNRIPEKMYRKLVDSRDDERQIFDEVANAIHEGEL